MAVRHSLTISNRMEQLGREVLQYVGRTEAELLDTMAYTMLYLSFVVFLGLHILKVKAPYGRYTNSIYGPAMNSTVAWFIQELPSFAIPVGLAAFTTISDSFIVGRFLLGGFVIHYFQRTFIYPFLIRSGNRSTVLTAMFALVFCCFNGFLQGAYLLHMNVYQDTWLTDPRFLIGTLLFFAGLLINLHSDSVLRNLRKPGETGYKIPQGGLFNYVSGANFLGEIIEWTGYAIACWSLPGLAFAVLTASNIGPRALHHHKWYLQKFEDYPKTRKALIPFLL